MMDELKQTSVTVNGNHHDANSNCDGLKSVDMIVLEMNDGTKTDEAIQFLETETELCKALSYRKLVRRSFVLDPKEMCLRYHPTRKPPCSSKMPVYDLLALEEVRRGWRTDIFNKLDSKRKTEKNLKKREDLIEENCFSLVFENKTTVDLIAPNKETCDLWVKGMNALLANSNFTKREEQYQAWLREQFHSADINKNGSLNFAECQLLLKKLNICMTRRQARILFDAADFRKTKLSEEDALDEDEFVKFFFSLASRPEIEEIFNLYSVNNTGIMGAQELKMFMEKEQKMTDVNLEDCINFIQRFQDPQRCIPGFMTAKGFEMFLFTKIQDVFNYKHKEVYQDMTQPISNYYIASSHNTYLIKDQLIGESSVEGYIKSLKKGCRCVEIDIWDGADNLPIVYHGNTLTSRILLSDVLDVIQDYAFSASNYPLILSLEVHCSLPQQVVIAKLIKTKLSEFLYDGKVESEDELPSPDQLQKQIFIKAKKLKVGCEHEELEEEEEEEDEIENTDSHDGKCKNGKHATVHSSKMAPELSDLVNYFQAKTFKSFEDCKNWKVGEMFSLSETKATKLATSSESQFIECMKNRVCRIYPRGTRTDSSNYFPIPFWNVGCQMVALNYQTYDTPMLLNDARFADNGNCGYVLKPAFLRSPKAKLDLEIKMVVKIKIISGQKIPKPGQASEGEVVDPYVVLRVIGHPSDEQRHKTRFILNNGFNPVWKEEFELIVRVPELALLCFLVYDQNHLGKNEILGQFALPFTSLAEGYRHVHLLDSRGVEIVPATLFVHIAIKKTV